MRRLLIAAMLGLVLSTNVGCFLPAYSGDPLRRTRQLIFSSENMRSIHDEWERIWFHEMPDHQTPFRVHGGVI